MLETLRQKNCNRSFRSANSGYSKSHFPCSHHVSQTPYYGFHQGEAITKWPIPTTVTEAFRVLSYVYAVSGGYWANVKTGTSREGYDGSSSVLPLTIIQGQTKCPKLEHQRASGLLQPLEIPMWNGMRFPCTLPTAIVPTEIRSLRLILKGLQKS
ncbi:hypothetical protein Tco_1320499 [Tanacetum coccineum]